MDETKKYAFMGYLRCPQQHINGIYVDLLPEHPNQDEIDCFVDRAVDSFERGVSDGTMQPACMKCRSADLHVDVYGTAFPTVAELLTQLRDPESSAAIEGLDKKQHGWRARLATLQDN